MKNILFLLLLFTGFKGLTQRIEETYVVPGELIVKFSDEALNLELIDDSEVKNGYLYEVMNAKYYQRLVSNDAGIDFENVTFRKVTRFTTADSVSISRTGRKVYVPHFWAVLNLQFDESIALEDVMTLLSNEDYILYAHNNWKVDYYGANDTLYVDQTNLHAAAFPDGMINVDSAWTLETGKPFVKVGISDSGFDTTHIDLEMFYGFVYGYEADLNGEYWYQDLIAQGHGSACAGVIGAKRNNNLGVAGIASGDSSHPGVTTYGLALTSNPVLDWGAVSIIEAAYDSGADTGFDSWINDNDQHGFGFGLHVLNCSWGAPVAAKGGEEEKGLDPESDNFVVDPNCVLCYEAGEFAYRNGMTIVASRGNTGTPGDTTHSFPATFSIEEGVISVGGSGLDGHVYNPSVNAPTNNSGNMPLIGRGLDLVAPYSDTMVRTIEAKGLLSNSQSNLYRGFAGTSAAAPQVTGVVALMLSFYNVPDCYSYDNLAPEDVEHILEITATDKGQTYAAPPMANVGYDKWTGHGLVNAFGALKGLEKPKYRVFHSSDSMIINQNVQQIGTAELVCLSTQYTSYGPLSQSLGIPQGNYLADVYEVSTTYGHSVWTSSPTDTILSIWTRSSDSEGFGLHIGQIDSTAVPVPTINCTSLKTRPHIFLDSFNDSVVVLHSYYYHIKDTYPPSGGLNHWLPSDTNNSRMSYSLYSYDSNRTSNLGFNCDSLTQYDVDYSDIEENMNSNVVIFPNPVSDQLFIESSDFISFVDIYSIQGQLIFRETTSTETKQVSLSFVNLPKGVYILHIAGRTRDTYVKKIIKS